MKQNKRLLSASRTAIIAGLVAISIAACSDDASFVSPELPVIPAPPPAPPPPPPPPPPAPPPPAVSATQAASQLGAGFATAFGAGPNAAPRNPSFGDIVDVDPGRDPIDIIDPSGA